MIRITILLAVLAGTTLGADHVLFKNCSRISFCNKLRNFVIPDDSVFKAEVSSWKIQENVVKIPLTNNKMETLILEISLLQDQLARIKIKENNSKRYELSDVLEDEPKAVKVHASFDGNSYLKLVPHGNIHSKIEVKVRSGPPFKVEFYNADKKLEVVLDGKRLLMENENGIQTFSVEFDGATRLYGLHHHATDLELPETADASMDPFRLRNSDNAGYEVGSPMALYGSVPVVYGHSNISTSGIFLHNAAEQWVDLSYKTERPSAYFMVESGTLDLFVFLGKTPKQVVRRFARLTGVAHLPQLWTLGYHQCRWSYYTQEQVKNIVAEMDRHNFPIDAIWLDVDHTDGKRYFTWSPKNFSDPEEMQRNLSSTNRKLVTISDPHLKVDENYPVYAEAKGKYFVKWANGSDFQGNCWPGLSSYLDFLNPEARDFYASWYSYDKYNGSTEILAGIWNDMNEPSVFDDSLEKTMPFELLHHGNVPHRDIHNIYGFLQTKATHQGLLARDGGKKRPFVLTRSHFAGSQRYAALWTGDNTADWPYMRVSYSECLLSNLVGLVFCGADIGGFFGNPDVELLQRWYQAAVWLPFYRGHAEETTEMREPYLFSKSVQDVIRKAMRIRYKHIPVLYTLFYEHTLNADPIIRPLFYEYPGTVDINNHILIGSDILARPVMEPSTTHVTVHFPGDSTTLWYRMDEENVTVHHGGTSENFAVDITTSPYFYRGGSIIARKDVERPSTTDMANDPYTLYINLGVNKESKGNLYVDDYTSFEYEKLHFNYVHLTFDPASVVVYVKRINGIPDGFDVSINRIVVHDQPPIGTRIYENGEFVVKHL